MKLEINIENQTYDIGTYHTAVICCKDSQLVQSILENIAADCELELINNEEKSSKLIKLSMEMEERYDIIFQKRCRRWYSPKLNGLIKPKVIIINVDVIKRINWREVLCLFQKSAGCGMFVVVGYSKRSNNYNYHVLDTSPIKINLNQNM